MAVKRKDGRWQAGVRHAGRRYTFYGDTRAAADVAAEEFRRRIRGHTAVELNEWAAEWLARKDLAPSTHASYKRLYGKYCRPLGALPLTALTVMDLQAAVDAAPYGSRRKLLAVLRACLNDAVRTGLISGNPAQLVRVPAYVPKGQAMQRAEAQAMLAHAGRYAPLYRVALGTGLRLGELLALTPNDVRNGRVYVTKSKTRAGVRSVPVPTAVLPCLTAIATADFCFSTTRGTACSPTHVRQRLYAACTAADIDRYRFHDLRHTYATWALESGIPVHVLSKLMGHSSVAVTIDVYGRHATDDIDVDGLAV